MIPNYTMNINGNEKLLEDYDMFFDPNLYLVIGHRFYPIDNESFDNWENYLQKMLGRSYEV